MGILNMLAEPLFAPLGVIPVLVGPLQALMAILPGILVALGGMLITMFKPSAIKRFLLLLWSQKFIIGPIVVVVIGLVFLWGILFPSQMPELKAGLDVAKNDWTMWRGGPARRGFVPAEVEEPAHGNVVWSYADGDIKTFYSSPAVVGDRVYATSARWEFFKKDGSISCLDARTGDVVWKYSSDGYRATFSSPAIVGKYLVVGEGLHLTNDARVFCIDVEKSAKERKGVKLWDYRTKSHVESSPCIADGKAFIGAGDDGLYCFDLDPANPDDVEPRWHLSGDQYPDCETSPVYYDGHVYFGLGIGGQAIVCVEADTGKEVWRLDTPCPAFGSPAIADGKLYAGMGHGDFVNTAEKAAALRRDKLKSEGKSPEEIEKEVSQIKPGGEVWCIDLATHNVDWKFKTGRVILGAVAVDGDRIFFGSRDKNLYCVSTKGEPIGKWDAHAPIITSPAVGEKYVYVVTESGELYGLDKNHLTSAWDVSLNSPSFSSPAVALGHVYVGTSSNGLLCVGEPGVKREPPIWRGALGGPGRGGWCDGSMVSDAGAYGWGFAEPFGKSEGSEPAEPVTLSAPPAYMPGAVYAGFNQGGKSGLAKLTVGKDLGAKPTMAWVARSTNPVAVSAAAVEGAVFFVDGRRGDADRALRCVDPTTGEVRWQIPVGSDGSGEFIVTHDKLILAGTAKGLVCLDISSPAKAVELWRSDIGDCVGVPLVSGDLVAAAVDGPGRLAVLDLYSGTVLWERELALSPLTGPVLVKGRSPTPDSLWIGQNDGIKAYSLIDGEPLAAVQCGRPIGRIIANGSRLAVLTRSGQVVVVDAAKATEIVRIDGATGGVLPIVTEDAVLYVGDEVINRYDFRRGESVLWARVRANWPGKVVTPMIMVHSHVLFATDKRGLVCMKPKA